MKRKVEEGYFSEAELSCVSVVWEELLEHFYLKKHEICFQMEGMIRG